MKLMEIVENIRKAEKLSVTSFSDKLGVHRATYIRARNSNQPSLKMLKGIRKVYPGLSNDIDIFLSNNATNGINNFKNDAKQFDGGTSV